MMQLGMIANLNHNILEWDNNLVPIQEPVSM